MSEVPKWYRGWFYAAAVYNLAWGVAVFLFPTMVIQLLGVAHLVTPVFLQCIAMFVAVFAFGYWLMARDPVRYSGFIWIGLAGKFFGPVGFMYYAIEGTLHWSFGLAVLTNDVAWWPVFFAFALRHGRHPLS